MAIPNIPCFILLLAGVSLFWGPEIRAARADSVSSHLDCQPTVPDALQESLHLSSDSATFQVEKPAGAYKSYYKIDHIRFVKKSIVFLGKRVDEGIGCAGSCGETTFSLSVKATAAGNNATLKLSTSGFSERRGQYTSTREYPYQCKAVALDRLRHR